MLEKNPIKSRLLEYCRYLKIPVSRFEKESNLSNGYFNQIRKKPSLDKLDSMHEAFPNLNLDWLISGKGSMLMNDNILEKENWIVSDDIYDSEKHDQESLKRVGLRIDELSRLKHLDYKKFAEKVNVDYEDLVSVISGSEAATEALLNNILTVFPDVNPCWIFTGIGKALIDIKPTAIPLSVHTKAIGTPIPLVSQTAVAGFGNSEFAIAERDVKEYYIVPKFKYCHIDFMIEISGSSMYPKYNSGDVVACTIIRESHFIQWNKCHVIATKEQGILVKRLLPSEKPDCIKAVSDNEKYPPFDIPKEEITGIAIVAGVIRLE